MADNTGISETVEVTGYPELRARIPSEAKIRKVVTWIMNSYAAALQREMRSRIPKRTSHTAQTIEVHTDFGKMELTVGSADPVVRWLEQGTGIYGPQHQRIFPVNAQVLAWPGGTFGTSGSLRLTGSIRAGAAGAGAAMQFRQSIAGMKGTDFIMKSIDATEPFLKTLLDRSRAMVFTLDTNASL